jgi:hypothetical protein
LAQQLLVDLTPSQGSATGLGAANHPAPGIVQGTWRRPTETSKNQTAAKRSIVRSVVQNDL